MKKIKYIIFTCIFFMFIPIVKAANDFNLDDEYLYYCKYELETIKSGGTKYEKRYKFPFYVYVYDDEVVPIIKYENSSDFYNMKECDAYHCIIYNERDVIGVYDYTELDEFFDIDKVHCPTIYTKEGSNSDVITGYSNLNTKAYEKVEIKKGNIGENLGEVTEGDKFNTTYHFTSEANLEAIKDKTISLSFFYNSKEEKCLEVNGIKDCQSDFKSIVVPVQMTKQGGGVINVDFLLDPENGEAIYENNSYDSFEQNTDIHLYATKNGNHVMVFISNEEKNTDIPLEEGEGTGGNLGEEGGGSSGGNGSFTPGKICEGDSCNISLSTFCEMPNVARTLKFLGLLINLAKILVPAIIIIMGFINLFQIITNGKYEEAKKSAVSIVKRIFIGVFIFLLPGIINMLFDTASNIIGGEDGSNFDNCVNCVLDPDNCNLND